MSPDSSVFGARPPPISYDATPKRLGSDLCAVVCWFNCWPSRREVSPGWWHLAVSGVLRTPTADFGYQRDRALAGKAHPGLSEPRERTPARRCFRERVCGVQNEVVSPREAVQSLLPGSSRRATGPALGWRPVCLKRRLDSRLRQLPPPWVCLDCGLNMCVLGRS